MVDFVIVICQILDLSSFWELLKCLLLHTETLWSWWKRAVKIETFPTLKDSLWPKSDHGPQHSLNLIISAHHGPWSKYKYFSAHQIENFLNFSKLTQLLFIGKFLRPLGAFKQNRTCYLIRCGPVVVVLDQDIIEHSKVWLGQHRFGRFSHSSCQFLWGLKCVFPTEYVKNF